MMSVMLHANSGRIESSGGFGCVAMDVSKLRDIKGSVFVEEDELTDSVTSFSSVSLSSSSSSSIGNNSDDDDDDDESGDYEVQSGFKGSLDMMDSLEEALPIRRGISNFYNGKSKSFTSLADASAAPSIKDITKTENAYTRKRRNLLASSHVWDKCRRYNGGGISKRSVSLSKSALALAVAMSSSEEGGESNTNSPNSTPRSLLSLPPLYPQARAANKVVSSPRFCSNTSARRSFSVADLQHCPSPANMQ